MDDQREKIVAAARKLIRYFGIKKTSISDIAKEAGMSQSNLYYYFKNKEAIYTEVIYRESMKLQEKLVTQVEQENDVSAKLISYLRSRFEYLNELRGKYFLLFKEYYSHAEGIKKVRDDFYHFESQTVGKILSELPGMQLVLQSALQTLIMGYELRLFMGEDKEELLSEIKDEIQLLIKILSLQADEELNDGNRQEL
ncbi:MAG: TetR/AcrR family transcriptional regulator [Candidatus Cloacimonetes bacterium]|nr:TetR/AcrR family transcriptional regulator [Candidatus Cloacimonadota bacterium]